MTRLSVLTRLNDELHLHILRLQTAYAALLVLPASIETINHLFDQIEGDEDPEHIMECFDDMPNAVLELSGLISAAKSIRDFVADLEREERSPFFMGRPATSNSNVTYMYGTPILLPEDN